MALKISRIAMFLALIAFEAMFLNVTHTWILVQMGKEPFFWSYVGALVSTVGILSLLVKSARLPAMWLAFAFVAVQALAPFLNSDLSLAVYYRGQENFNVLGQMIHITGMIPLIAFGYALTLRTISKWNI